MVMITSEAERSRVPFLPRFSGPMQRTTTDFWRLIWQEKIQVVVMVTNLTEGHTKKCDQYWPEPDICNYGPFSVTLTEKIVYADFIIRKFRVRVQKKLC